MAGTWMPVTKWKKKPTHTTSQNYKNSKKMGSHQGLGEGRIGRAQRISKAMEILYNTVMVDIYYYKFVQTCRMYIKSEP